MECPQGGPVWEIEFYPNSPMDYQNVCYVIKTLQEPLQDALDELKRQLNDAGGSLEISLDYTKLINKPQIESKELIDNVLLDEIGIQAASNSDIDSLF